MIRVREAKPEDLKAARAVSALAEADLRRVYRPTAEAIQRKADRSPVLTRLVALRDGEIVGTVEYEVTEDRVQLLGLDVHPEHRRLGVARALVVRIAERGAEEGARILSLYTIKETGNAEIFERLGFQIVEEAPAQDFESDTFDILTEYRMEREL
ncbi:MAG: GNAT family N-acetyltransferase [Planctomycetota bacterium]